MKKIKILLVLAVCFLGFFRAQETCAETGRCGVNLTWELDDSVLTITGTGPMDNYIWFDSQLSPWYPSCQSIKKVVIDPAVTSIGDYAFYRCSNLTSIIIPNSITSIRDGVFQSCTSLSSITLPNTITSIGSEAFKYCGSLTSITLPSTVTSIGPGAFMHSGLTSFSNLSSPQSIDINTFYGVAPHIALYVPLKYLEAYKSAPVWKDFDTIIEPPVLISLIVSEGNLSPEFHRDIFNYTVTVPYSVESIVVDVKTFSPAALWPDLEQPGIQSLEVGENIFNFGVFADNRKDYNIYALTVIRENSQTGFQEVNEQPVRIYFDNMLLHIDSPVAEQINIYSVTGKFLYGLKKPAGKTSSVISRPERILIVRGSSGWVRKIII